MKPHNSRAVSYLPTRDGVYYEAIPPSSSSTPQQCYRCRSQATPSPRRHQTPTEEGLGRIKARATRTEGGRVKNELFMNYAHMNLFYGILQSVARCTVQSEVAQHAT